MFSTRHYRDYYQNALSKIISMYIIYINILQKKYIKNITLCSNMIVKAMVILYRSSIQGKMTENIQESFEKRESKVSKSKREYSKYIINAKKYSLLHSFYLLLYDYIQSLAKPVYHGFSLYIYGFHTQTGVSGSGSGRVFFFTISSDSILT